MPPQQRDGLLDLLLQGVGFGGHGEGTCLVRAGSISVRLVKAGLVKQSACLNDRHA
jgi:hypothetical protein